MMDILREIGNWRSFRRFAPLELEQDKIEKILEAGRRAPSWQNLQPWHFLVIDQVEAKKELASIVATKKLIEKAPLLIAVLGNLEGFSISAAHEKVKEQIQDKMSDAELYGYLKQKIASPLMCSTEILLARLLEQVSYATAFMILEASHQGLGSCVVGGIDNMMTENSEKSAQVKNFFKIQENFEILTILALGYSSEEIEQRSRKPLAEISSWNQF